jgi:nucleoside-diphosphate-sugar epimerase
MRIFVAGATGAIGRVLVPALVDSGHEVAGLTRKPERAAWLESVGATPIVLDVYSPDLANAVAGFEPEAVVHQLTDLPSRAALIPLKVAALNKVRTAGTDALIAAARAAGAERFLAQSVAFGAPAPVRKAVQHLEQATLDFPGVVARYGYFYGPGTWYPEGTDHSPRVSVESAARRTIELLAAEPGIYEVTDAHGDTYP